MSYQVLARKWRPGVFSELVGQEHVVSAISNALDNNRLHHAYLFTGTRGVGKTTIARIFSKSLNCETGMSSKPCGQCATCKEIEQGNYIDLLEIDAASRTKVEDTRELLDNVQYKPTRGEFKVYLIDEVHMLSKHSFNALLKTLEEPPPHVKFLLATTDPQKLPVTILSRCLQFNLKALSRAQISGQLEHILQQEAIPAEAPAIAQLARAAQGSMRDALSLTDQAIAQGDGNITNQVVTDMLGLMDKGQIIKLVHAVLNKDSTAVFEQVEQLSFQAPDYLQVLAEILSLLHQIALTQFVPDACKLETISARAIYQLAKTMPAEQVQLLYQVALQGKKDLPFAADGRSGLEMTLLRMLAFTPAPLNVSLDDFAELESTPVALPDQTENAAPHQESNHADNDKHEAAAMFEQQEQILTQAQEQHPGFVQQSGNEDVPQHVTEHISADSFEPIEPAMEPTQFNQPLSTSEIETQDQVPPQGEAQPVQAYSQTGSEQPAPDSFETQQPDFHSSVHHSNDDIHEGEQTVSSGQSSTESLLALKLKLQNVQPTAKDEEQPSSVKKSESIEIDSIGHMLSKKAQEPQASADVQVETSPQPANISPQVESGLSQQPSQDSDTEQSPEDALQIDEIDAPFASDTPQKSMDAEKTSSAQEQEPPWQTSNAMPEFVGKTAPQLAPQPAFDPNAHLEEDIEVDVDFDVPPFLDSGEKVVAANQLDTWSQLIEQMSVAALTKQLALHSAYSKRDNQVHLSLLDSKQHLDTPSARQQLQVALSAALQQEIELVVTHEQPKNTPFAVQQTINHVRQQHAQEVVEKNESINLVRERFAASIVDNSIKPR